MEVSHHRQKITSLQAEYRNLEDEFREALHIEAGRYENLQGKYYEINSKANKQAAVLEQSTQREEKMRKMIAELTSL